MATKVQSHGIKLVLRQPEVIPPIVGAPAGQMRLRFRTGQIPKLFVRTADGIRSMFLEDLGCQWRARPDLWMEANVRRVRRASPATGCDVRKFKLFSFA